MVSRHGRAGTSRSGCCTSAARRGRCPWWVLFNTAAQVYPGAAAARARHAAAAVPGGPYLITGAQVRSGAHAARARHAASIIPGGRRRGHGGRGRAGRLRRPGRALPRHHPGRPGLWCALQGLQCTLDTGFSDLGALLPVTILAGLAFGAPLVVLFRVYGVALSPSNGSSSNTMCRVFGCISLSMCSASGASACMSLRSRICISCTCPHGRSPATCSVSQSIKVLACIGATGRASLQPLKLQHFAGAHWSLMPALTSELFGLQHFASNYSLVQVCCLCHGEKKVSV